MKITFWGTRGSIPSPSNSEMETSHFGGDTTCLSIESGDQLLILDAGSDIRSLGLHLMKSNYQKATLLFTHFHWDHIQGFPFFTPAFSPHWELEFYSPAFDSHTPALETVLRGQQRTPMFPIGLNQMAARFSFHSMAPNHSFSLQSSTTTLHIETAPLSHPGGCMGYRIQEESAAGSKIFVVATDTEHLENGLNPELQKLAVGADLLLYDAQYTEEEYAKRKGWGHSTWRHGLEEARAAQVKHLMLFHHDPTHADGFIQAMEKEAQQAGPEYGIQVSSARQLESVIL